MFLTVEIKNGENTHSIFPPELDLHAAPRPRTSACKLVKLESTIIIPLEDTLQAASLGSLWILALPLVPLMPMSRYLCARCCTLSVFIKRTLWGNGCVLMVTVCVRVIPSAVHNASENSPHNNRKKNIYTLSSWMVVVVVWWLWEGWGELWTAGCVCGPLFSQHKYSVSLHTVSIWPLSLSMTTDQVLSTQPSSLLY